MTFILVTQMFPSVMLLVPFYSIIGKHVSLLDTHLGLILVYISLLRSRSAPGPCWDFSGPCRWIWTRRPDRRLQSWQCASRIILPLTLPRHRLHQHLRLHHLLERVYVRVILTSRPEMKTLPWASRR